MIDTETKERVLVHTDGDAGPYLMVPLEQLDELRRVLDQHRIRYTVAEDAISLDGRPVIALIDFGRGVDANRVQAILDAA